MIALKSLAELKTKFNDLKGVYTFVLYISGPRCTMCRQIKPTMSKEYTNCIILNFEIPDDLPIEDFNTTLNELTGSTIMSLPGIFYVPKSGQITKTGFLPPAMIEKKILDLK